jgi:hypothetical protein
LVESNGVGLAPLNKVKIKHVDQSFMITLLMMDRKTRKKNGRGLYYFTCEMNLELQLIRTRNK